MRWYVMLAALVVLPLWASEPDEWDDWGEEWVEETPSPWLAASGYLEAGAGYRLESDSAGLDRQTLGEIRGRLESGYRGDSLQGDLRVDLRYDDVVEGWEWNVRTLTLGFAATESVEIKLGRQVLTWGTGDFLFLNDLFPKDWQAFFSGQDDEYLKAPVNAIKASYFGGWANLNLAWIPRFEADNYLNGERFSFFHPGLDQFVAPAFRADEPERDAWAARLYGQRGSMEWALYGYWGYTGSPEASDEQGHPDFARLNGYGASLVSPLGSGLVNLEISYHDLLDQDGGSPGQPADKWLWLAGYQRELISHLTLGLQYQFEHIVDYSAFKASQPWPEYAPEQNRHLGTVRLDYRAMQDKLILSLFGFYSPTDQDYYLRPQLEYRWDDHWTLKTGFNLMGGQDEHTFFGRLQDNSNGWVRLRYHY